MTPLTDRTINDAADAEKLVQLLIEAAEQVPPRLRERILSFGPSIIAPLIALATNEELVLEEAPGEGWAPIHAVELLGELKPDEAIEPLLRLLAQTDWGLILHEAVMEALPKFGEVALEPTLAAYASTSEPELQRALLHVLSRLRPHDERIFRVIADGFAQDREFGAMMLAEYGDPRALPLLSEAIDRYEAGADKYGGDHTLVELEAAIQSLGGEFTPEQRRKIDQILGPQEVRRQRISAALEYAVGQMDLDRSSVRGARAMLSPARPARAARNVGRNDPCPCGSGKKYKKCCLGIESAG